MHRFFPMVLLVAASTACTPQLSSYCLFDDACERVDQKPGARCFYDGKTGQLCAWPDSGCASGYRWNAVSGAVSNQCVAPEHVRTDGGAGD